MAACVLSLAAATPARALPVPPLRGHVNDLAGWLDAGAQARLERQLAAFERGTGNQFVLLIIPTLEGEPLEDYSMRVAEAWKVGRKGADNGLLLLIAANDREARIEVGYGLEGRITDLESSRIIRGILAPALREGDVAGGIGRAFDALERLAGGEAAEPPDAGQVKSRGLSLGTWIFMLVLVLLVLRGRGGGMGGLLLGSMLGRGWSSRGRGGFGGGWGGGGGGGFSGGGGSFGGGGASGGW